MATLASLTLDVEEMLYGIAQVERPREDTLNTAVDDANDVEWRFDTDTMWKRDDLAEYTDTSGTAGEIVRFTEDHPSGADATMRRGQPPGPAAAGGFSIGDVFRKNPVYPRQTIQRFINQVIDNDLWPDVWFWTERSLTYTSGDTTYDLTAADYVVDQMYQYNLNSDNAVHPFPRGYWKVVNTVNTSVASTGKALRVFHVFDSAATVYYTARTKPASASVGDIPARITEIIPWGVVAKLLLNRIVPKRRDPARNIDPTRTSSNQATQDAAAFLSMFNQMKQDERKRLQREASEFSQSNYIHPIPRRG